MIDKVCSSSSGSCIWPTQKGIHQQSIAYDDDDVVGADPQNR